MLENIPAGRFGTLEDLIGATVFLCSDASRYVTGQLLYVDGGHMASICDPAVRGDSICWLTLGKDTAGSV
jgi:enoyl-[acyl-carrier-protein] reductase (NADH)